ncbi:Bug family tripartite tricarboxylate transporter substrate binding protein [Candidimonas nitroreducens]|uniref:LacI family transcriptional regulator n=1 Tax=Candidimonas nitroreducens TaxID=683354 RepID=A0A225MAS0_9BURK|nr:tripartite tricarboxylate transporter substrate binding protein [Candidimonas nitroreducens]OWT57383.1 hypothetical protein CEY11_15775 [Candidimonas nitroreducens]
MSAFYISRRAILKSSAALAAIAVARAAYSKDEYPARLVKVVVPYGPGGAVDSIARQISALMARDLGQSIIVENRAGAGSNIGSIAVARSRPDGYTLLMASPANVTNPFLYPRSEYAPLKDFAPIGLAAQVPTVFVAAPGAATGNTVAEVIAHAKEPGAPPIFAHGGVGSSEHLATELFRLSAKVNITEVPYKGGAAAFPDLIGGRVQYMFTNLLGILPLVRGKRVKVLAVLDNQRAALIPDVPTMPESGLPNVLMSVWYGMMAPAGTGRPIIERLAHAMHISLEDAELREKLESSGARIVDKDPAAFAAFLKEESARWGSLIKRAKITLN